MCGRFTLRTPLNLLLEQFRAESARDVQLELFGPRYNVAPTQQVVIVRLDAGGHGRELTTARWGLVPSWSRDPKSGAPLINARGETVAEKPSFRSAFKQRRCLLIADGFYEWQIEGEGKSASKRPHFIHYADDHAFAFAGLWEVWSPRDKQGDPLLSCTLVNTGAIGWMTDIHHRMPIILSENEYEIWLTASAESRELTRLLEPREYPDLVATPVSTHVNRVKNDDAQCVAPEARLF